MPMIKCPHCGQQISDFNDTCPYCNSSIVRCPECGVYYERAAAACPGCGKKAAAKVGPYVIQEAYCKGVRLGINIPFTVVASLFIIMAFIVLILGTSTTNVSAIVNAANGFGIYIAIAFGLLGAQNLLCREIATAKGLKVFKQYHLDAREYMKSEYPTLKQTTGRRYSSTIKQLCYYADAKEGKLMLHLTSIGFFIACTVGAILIDRMFGSISSISMQHTTVVQYLFSHCTAEMVTVIIAFVVVLAVSVAEVVMVSKWEKGLK